MATYKIKQKFKRGVQSSIDTYIGSNFSCEQKPIGTPKRFIEIEELPYIYEQRYDYMDPTSILPNSFHFDLWNPTSSVFNFRSAFMKIRNNYNYPNYGEDPKESGVENFDNISYLQNYSFEQLSDKAFCLNIYERIVADWNRIGMEISDYEHENRSTNDHFVFVSQEWRKQSKLVGHVMHVFKVVMDNLEKFKKIHEEAKKKEEEKE